MHTHRKIIYRLAFLDGIALLLLVFIAVPVKYLLDIPLGVKILGPLHGTLFLLLMIATVSAVSRGALRPGLAALLFVGALLPLGAFYADYRLRQAYPDLAAR
jgi:integral membrane protein